MRSSSGVAIALTSISAAALVFVVLGLLYVLLFFCCSSTCIKNSGDSADPEYQLEAARQKPTVERLEGGEMAWLRSCSWGPHGALFAIKEEEEDDGGAGGEETTDEEEEEEEGRRRGRKSSRRSSVSLGGSQDSEGASPSMGATPFLTPLSTSPFSTPPTSPSRH